MTDVLKKFRLYEGVIADNLPPVQQLSVYSA